MSLWEVTMEMRRNTSLSPTDLMCQSDPRNPYVASHMCHSAKFHSAGRRGSRMELWSHSLWTWEASLHGYTALTTQRRVYLFFSERMHQVALKSWLHLGTMSCQISSRKSAWITTGSKHEATGITDDWWWLMWQLSRCSWWRCSHGAAWYRDPDLMPKKDTGRQTQHLDAHLSSPSMNPDCCAQQEEKKDDPEEELPEGGLWRKTRFLCPK